MLVQLLAGLFLLLALWTLFRFAMALRFAKLSRDEGRRAEESRGRRVVAEIPREGEDLVFFLEDDQAFYWGAERARKSDILGVRLLLNGGIIAAFSRDGAHLPGPPSAEDYEGRERWDVILYLRGGRTAAVPCGTMREGVSREIATRVFERVRATASG